MALQAYALLCALAVVSCAAVVARRAHVAYLLAGLLVGVVLLNPTRLLLLPSSLVMIEPAQGSLLLLLLAFARIRNRMRVPLLVFCGGLVASLWLQALVALEYPPLPAALMVLLCIVVTIWRSWHHPAFNAPALLEEAFLVVMGLALALSVIPETIKGWQSAVGLQAADNKAAAATADIDTLWLIAAFVAVGMLYKNFKYRWKPRQKLQ